MRTGEVAGAEEEFADDFPAGKAEGLLEELDPFRFRERMMRIEPGGKAAVRRPQRQHLPGVVDGGLALEAVADDAGVGPETLRVARAVARHRFDVEAAVGLPEGLALLEDGEPAQSRLVDFQDQPLEERRLVGERHAVFGVVIGAMPFVA